MTDNDGYNVNIISSFTLVVSFIISAFFFTNIFLYTAVVAFLCVLFFIIYGYTNGRYQDVEIPSGSENAKKTYQCPKKYAFKYYLMDKDFLHVLFMSVTMAVNCQIALIFISPYNYNFKYFLLSLPFFIFVAAITTIFDFYLISFSDVVKTGDKVEQVQLGETVNLHMGVIENIENRGIRIALSDKWDDDYEFVTAEDDELEQDMMATMI